MKRSKLRNQSTVFSYVQFFSPWDFGAFRFLGPGLGNLLFPWARFVVCSEKYGLTQLAPTWPQFKLGPFLRGESDKRLYGGLFSETSKQIKGSRKLLLMYTLQRIPESRIAILTNRNIEKDVLIVFKGLGNYFADLEGHKDLIRKELFHIIHDRHKEGLRYDFRNSISVHVRLADFKVSNSTTPITWFCAIIRKLIDKMNKCMSINIFSDGSDSELSELLSMPNARRMAFGSSISDMLALSSAQVLVGSGSSSFNAWGAYLGDTPLIWPRNSFCMGIDRTRNNDTLLCMSEEEEIPDNFLKAIYNRYVE